MKRIDPMNPRGVPTPNVVHVHPYPTRFHGGIWTRPVFGFPFVQSPQAVFKPDDFTPAAYKRYPFKETSKPMSYAGLGALQYDTRQGVFRAGGRGGGIFDGTIAGLGSTGGYPWRAYSDATKAVQTKINAILKANKHCPITADGKLGPATCAAGTLAMSLDPGFVGTWGPVAGSCQEVGKAPGKEPCAAAPTSTAMGPAAPTTAEAVMTPPSGPMSRKTVAFVVGGLAAAGFVYLYTKRRRG
jgi:hypothetical protein